MSIIGTWNVTLSSPMGPQAGTMEVTGTEDAFEGEITGALGSVPISDGSTEGDTATFKAALTKPMPMNLDVSVTVDGDTLEGKASTPMGAFPIKGERA